MKKLAIVIAALTLTVYAQSPPVSEALERSGKPAKSGQPTEASVGANSGSTSTNRLSGALHNAESALGGPAAGEYGSSQSLTSLTPAEIRIIRAWIRQSIASGSVPSALKPVGSSGAAGSGVSGSGTSSSSETTDANASGGSSGANSSRGVDSSATSDSPTSGSSSTSTTPK